MLLAALLSISVVLSSISFNAPSTTISSLKPRTYPQIHLTPPANQSGVGLPVDLTESMNGWQAWNLRANNTLANYNYHNASFSRGTVSGYSLAWQSITIENLRATYDIRGIQAGIPLSSDFLQCGPFVNGYYPALAMNFTPPDRVNLTVVSLYYGTANSPGNIPLYIQNDNGGKPGSVILGSGTLTNQPDDWHDVPVAASGSPITLNGGVTYWIVMNGSAISGNKYYKWFFISDLTNPSYDNRLACYYTNSWKQESDHGLGWNFLALAKVLPVGGDRLPSVYNSPARVDMWLNGTTQILNNVTRVSNTYRTFFLSTNTSVTFISNWTTRFECSFVSGVMTQYVAYEGLTLWNASFSVGGKPSNPYTWYNLSFKVSPIPPDWTVTNPSSNVTNTQGYPSDFTAGSGYYLITQKNDVNSTLPWSNYWLILSKSTYTITASAPPEVIQGQAFNVTVSATTLPSSRTILVFDRAKSMLYNRTFLVSSSPYYHQLRLNATGDNNIILVDRGLSQNEVSFFNASWVTVLRALTQINLESQTFNATWGDQIHVRVHYENATNGVKPFPSSPRPSFNVAGYAVPLATDEGGGWYSFNYSSSQQPAAGSYLLSVSAKYMGTYANLTTLNLNLAKINMTLSIIMDQTSVSVDSSLTVSAQLTFRNGTKVKDGFNVRFDFLVSWENGSQSTVTRYKGISNGTATDSLLALNGMKSITVTVTYEGTSILHEVADTRQNIPVTTPQGLPIPLLLGIGVGGALVVIIPLAVIVRRRRSRETEARKTSVLRQTASLAQLIVVDLRSGRSVFSRSIGSEESVDPNLISGFLSANQSIIGEVFKKQNGAGLRFADYGEYKVISNVGTHIMATLFATETAGVELKDVLQKFTDKFEKKYGKALESWDGDMSTFKNADEIADEVFCLPLTAPHMLLEVPTAQLSKVERAAVQSARILSGERGVFFMTQVIDFLLTKQGLKRGKAMDVINSLTSKGVFRQLTIEQAAQVVKSCAEKSALQS